MIRVSIDIEEEHYKLANKAIVQAIEANCMLSYYYALLVKEQILNRWCNKTDNKNSA
jgi:hypothetical protein